MVCIFLDDILRKWYHELKKQRPCRWFIGFKIKAGRWTASTFTWMADCHEQSALAGLTCVRWARAAAPWGSRLTFPVLLPRYAHDYTRLAEVGKLESPKSSGKYETGQLLLHRVFGYRGVVLFPWTARIFDRDITDKRRDSASGSASETQLNADGLAGGNSSKEVKSRTHTFYQVLIDSRDAPFIRAQTEAVTFLGSQESSRSLYAIPGLDYVAHEDIIPYISAEKTPVQHELFDKFLIHCPERDPPFMAQETLRAWQKKNHPWLELSDVHRESTEGVRVTVIPFYMGCRESQTTAVYWWRYCIRLENLGPLWVQLRERHWRIFSLSGTLETVRGRGVVGQEPRLSRSQPAFQYSSHVSLQAPSGHMWGTFRMEREDGYTFDCRIPPFSLESKSDGSNPSSESTP